MSSPWDVLSRLTGVATSSAVGPRGPMGPQGPSGGGSSLPPGGATDTILVKLSGTSGDAGWRLLLSADLPAHNHSASQITSGTIATARLGSGTASTSTYLRGDNTWTTVLTSIAIDNGDLGGILNILPDNLSTAGSMYLELVPQSANLFFASPSTGSPAKPTFRAIATADLPSGIPVSKLGVNAPTSTTWLKGTGSWTSIGAADVTSGVFAAARLGAGSPNSTKYLRGDSTWQTGPMLTLAGQSQAVQYFEVANDTNVTLSITSSAGTHSFSLGWTGTLGTDRLGSGTANSTTFLRGDSTWASVGTVTSVGLTMPGIFSVSGSPVTGSGTLAVSLATQVQNTVLAGPTSGADAAPTFRALGASDLPTALRKSPTTATDNQIGGATDVQRLQLKLASGGTANLFEALSAADAVLSAINSIGRLLSAAGSLSAPGIAGIADDNTGIVWTAADTLAISCGGSAQVTFTTSSATFTQQIIPAAGAAATPSIKIGGTATMGFYDATTSGIGVNNGASGTLFYIGSGGLAAGTGDLEINKNNNRGLFINGSASNGAGAYVVMGSNAPTSCFVAIGAARDVVQFKIKGNSTQTSDLVLLQNNAGTTLFQITGAGRLTMGGATSIANTTLKAGSTALAPLGFTSGSLTTSVQSGAMEFLTDKFYLSSSERAVIATEAEYFVDLSSDVTDYTFPSLVSLLYCVTDSGTYNFSSLAGYHEGKVVRIYLDKDDLGSLIIKHNYTTGTTAAMRFYNLTAADITLSPGEMAEAIYCQNIQRWLTRKL